MTSDWIHHTQDLEWTVNFKQEKEFEGSLKKHTKIILMSDARPMPQPRQNYRSRFTDPKAQRYNEWRKVIRDSLRIAWNLKAKSLISTPIKASFEFGATSSAPIDARRNKDGNVDKRAVKSVFHYDLNNLVKSTEDIMNGIVYIDDNLIREYGLCRAMDTSKNFIKIIIEDSDANMIMRPEDKTIKNLDFPL